MASMAFLSLSNIDTGEPVLVNMRHVESVAPYQDGVLGGTALRTASGNTVFVREGFDAIVRSFSAGDIGAEIKAPRV